MGGRPRTLLSFKYFAHYGTQSRPCYFRNYWHGRAGKSSLIDELVSRFLQHFLTKIGVISVDPSKEKPGALLGDQFEFFVEEKYLYEVCC